MTISEWLTADEAAGYLKVKTRTLLLWVGQCKVRGYALSGTKRRVWRFRRADLDSSLFGHSSSDARLIAQSVLNDERSVRNEHGYITEVWFLRGAAVLGISFGWKTESVVRR